MELPELRVSGATGWKASYLADELCTGLHIPFRDRYESNKLGDVLTEAVRPARRADRASTNREAPDGKPRRLFLSIPPLPPTRPSLRHDFGDPQKAQLNAAFALNDFRRTSSYGRRICRSPWRARRSLCGTRWAIWNCRRPVAISVRTYAVRNEKSPTRLPCTQAHFKRARTGN
jgi:hypothetical protein